MTVNSGELLEYEDKTWVRAEDYVTLQAERDALAAEVERLRALMIEIAKGLGYGVHIIATYDGHGKPMYTCGIHNVAMGPHGDRCPECDRVTDSARESASTASPP